MNSNFFAQEQHEQIKIKIFKVVLTFTGIAFLCVTLLNLYNQRPLSNILLPLSGAFSHLILKKYYTKYKYLPLGKWIKRLYMAVLSWIYLPLAWITSPGSYSAMPYYALTIIIILVFLSLEKWEYIFSASALVITFFLFHLEPYFPNQFAPYVSGAERAFDLSMNFLLSSVIISIVLFIINHQFDDENQKIYAVSVTDPLTGLFNRRHFLKSLPYYRNDDYTLILMDLNHFKRINDTYGHHTGDEVLIEFSSILKSSCRDTDMAVRYGGDEFILLLHHANVDDAQNLEKRILEKFKPLSEKYQMEQLSIAFGYASNSDESIEEIIQKADEHLYQKKNKRSLSNETL